MFMSYILYMSEDYDFWYQFGKFLNNEIGHLGIKIRDKNENYA